MQKTKSLVFLADGMADEPLPELGDRTPLQAAKTPAMDRIAREGRCGSLLTLPEGFPTSSEVANMSVLGCDLQQEYCGRGPLEAAGRGVQLNPGDVAFRLNLTYEQRGRLRDYSGGHVENEVAAQLVELLGREFGGPGIRFATGVGYRTLLILSTPWASPSVQTEKPDDNQDERVSDHLPKALTDDGKQTAEFLVNLIREAPKVLRSAQFNDRLRQAGRVTANGVWPWSGGRAGSLRSFKDRYGISAAVISAVDVINGLGRLLGMDVITVPGATGYMDTNYEGKADAAIEALKTHDFVYLHVEAIDEVSHEGNVEKKLRSIEDFDSRVVSRALHRLPPNTAVAVLPDHPVPVLLRKHTRTPVPVAIRNPRWKHDSVRGFNEIDSPKGSLGAMKNGEFIRILLGLQPPPEPQVQ
jgi:2,3-bisphosphoglycerate-independent phosphoglycerate mutase